MTNQSTMRMIVLLLSFLQARGFGPATAKVNNDNAVLQASSNINSMLPLQKGSTCALITPFTPSGEIDVPELERLFQMHLEQETDNLCILGTTAEAAVMSMTERETVLKIAADNIKGKIPFMVGTGTINPDSVKAMTQQAIDMGADANLLVNPYYVKPPQRAMVRMFTEVADMGLPVVLYNVPGRTGVDVSDATLAICAEHENVVGVKDATGNIARVASFKKVLRDNGVVDPDDFMLFSGDDGTTLDFMRAGGDGCISVTANIVPGVIHRMMQAALKGDFETAAELNRPLEVLHQKLFVESNPIPAKWCANRLGMIKSAYCRPPLDEMDPAMVGVVEDALRIAGLL